MTVWLRNIYTPENDKFIAQSESRDECIRLAHTYLREHNIKINSLQRYWADREGHEVQDFGSLYCYIVLKGDNDGNIVKHK